MENDAGGPSSLPPVAVQPPEARPPCGSPWWADTTSSFCINRAAASLAAMSGEAPSLPKAGRGNGSYDEQIIRDKLCFEGGEDRECCGNGRGRLAWLGSRRRGRPGKVPGGLVTALSNEEFRMIFEIDGCTK